MSASVLAPEAPPSAYLTSQPGQKTENKQKKAAGPESKDQAANGPTPQGLESVLGLQGKSLRISLERVLRE